jgi:flagellar motor switch protein FliM
VNIEIAARFPPGALRLADLRGLAVGDLLVWPGDGAPGLIVDVSKRPKFAGRPGTISGNAAVELMRVAGQEPAPVRLTRISGGNVSTGVAEVPLEIRAVLAERLLSLQELGELRPGVRIEFPRAADAPVELRLGRRGVARGPLVRAGDRLSVRVESHRDSGAPRL